MGCRLVAASRVAMQGLMEFEIGRADALRSCKRLSPIQHPNPLRGCNSALAQYFDTPSLRVAGFEDEDEDEDDSRQTFPYLERPHSQGRSRTPQRYAAKAGPGPLRLVEHGIITRLIRDTPGNGWYPSNPGTNTSKGPPSSAERDSPSRCQTNPISPCSRSVTGTEKTPPVSDSEKTNSI